MTSRKHDGDPGDCDVFRTVRHMNAAGLERSFDVDVRVRQVEELTRECR